MKPLSEQLANLSVRVKNAEDAATAAQEEAHDKVVARVAQAQAAAEEAVQKVNQNIKSASDTASVKWNGMKAKIAADMDDLKSKVAQRKHDLSIKRAANYSQLLDEDASFAIDYAIASIEQAQVAVLDAIAGHIEVEKAKRTAADQNIRLCFVEADGPAKGRTRWAPPSPFQAGVSGERFTVSRCMLGRNGANRPFLVVETQKGPSMLYVDSILGSLLKPIDRRRFKAIVDRHDGDAYDKSFKSWDHLVALIFAQLSRASSLRGLELSFNANSHHHYHLNVGKLSRSTLSDANARRPVGVFAQTFAMLAEMTDRRTRQEGAEMVRLIDASPIPLGKMCKWAKWNGRIRGMKMHVVYHPEQDCPRDVEVTPANVNDVEIGRQVAIEAGATYVFDKGYYHFGWWKKINDTGAFFVTRTKVNTSFAGDQALLCAQTHR